MPITSNQLRWLAEKADGTRDLTFALIWDGNELTLVDADAALPNQRVGGDVVTPFDGAGLHGGAQVSLTFGDQQVPIDPTADAIFLTQSAVEKFVLPYYTRFKPPSEIQTLKESLFARDVIGAIHVPPSVTTGVTRPTFILAGPSGLVPRVVLL